MSNVFWFGCGAIAGITLTILMAPAWRRIGKEGRGNLLRFGLPLAGALLFVLAISAFSEHWGTSAPATAGTTVAGNSDMLASHADAIDDYERKVGIDPADASAWAGLASLYRQQRQFEPARKAFVRLVELKAMTADLWADYADVQASVSGSLAGEAEGFIDNALALDPAHAKALWLKASLAHEQGREADALQLWKRLRAVLPSDSSDARLVDNNIAEAERLTGKPALASLPGLDTRAAITGTVALDPGFSARVKPGTPIFIYAKAAGAGPPVAVMRTVTGSWPLRFRLDDSMAMMPERKLSDVETVTVEARISPSGDATAQSGDLYATSAPVNPRDGKPLALTIAMERK